PCAPAEITFKSQGKYNADDGDYSRYRKPPKRAVFHPARLRQTVGIDAASDQDRDCRIKWQYIMRLLGNDEFEHDPTGNQPGEKKLHWRLRTRGPDGVGRQSREQRARPEIQEE